MNSYHKLFGLLVAFSIFSIFLIQYTAVDVYSELQVAKSKLMRNCGKYPNDSELNIENVIWQAFESSKGPIKILNAYLDTRMKSDPLVRINIVAKTLKNNGNDTFYCQFWFEEGKSPQIVKASLFILMWIKGWGSQKFNKRPYLVSCPLKTVKIQPKFVSLVEKPCTFAKNRLKIIDNQPENGLKKKFGVCVKQIKFSSKNFVTRFVEWVHMIRILGAEKVHLRLKYIDPEYLNILEYLEEKGFIEVETYVAPQGLSDYKDRSKQTFLIEVSVLNDCFYRTRNLYDYIAILDPDEIILPMSNKSKTWFDLFKDIKKDISRKDGVAFQNLYFPEVFNPLHPGIPEYHHILQHTQRAKNFSKRGDAIKSIILTKNLVVCHNHIPMFCLPTKYCTYGVVKKEVGRLHHYRDRVYKIFNKTISDSRVWIYKDELMAAMNATLVDSGYEP